MRNNWSILLSSFILGLIFSVIFASWLRGSFVSSVINLAACFWVAGPLILLSAIRFVISFFRERMVMRRRATVSLGLAIIILTQLFSIKIGKIISKNDIRETQQFCESLSTQLEFIKEKTGQYPYSIEPVLSLAVSRPPRLFQHNTTYRSDGKSYSFHLRNPSQIMMGWDFSSKTKQWKFYD